MQFIYINFCGVYNYRKLTKATEILPKTAGSGQDPALWVVARIGSWLRVSASFQ